MSLKHKIYGFLFNFFRIFPVKTNKVSFIIDKKQSFKSNFDYIIKELDKRGFSKEYNFILKDKFSITDFYNLASSQYIFLNDNFFPIAYMNFSQKTSIIQLWHAPGAFKKFGYSVAETDDLKNLIKGAGSKIDFLFVSSSNIVKFYSEAFKISENKIISTGIPRMDYYTDEIINNNKSIRQKFENKYPLAKGKKLILYAPTFRENDYYNNIFNFFDLNRFLSSLNDEYSLIIRLHPKMFKFSNRNTFKDLDSNLNIIDCSDYENEQELLLVSDILISDYSSIMIEYAFLNKPIIFFAPDLDYYLNEDRGFYFNYDNVPGSIVKTTDDLINIIKEDNFDLTKMPPFLKFQFDYLDSNSSRRIIDYLLNNKQ